MTKLQMISSLTMIVTINMLSNVNAFTIMTPNRINTSLSMGLFDDLQLIFSEEGKKNRREYEERERAKAEAAQREIFERRRNPEKMDEYRRQTKERRKKLQEEREVWDFQNSVVEEVDENGETVAVVDPLETWEALREEGKIKVGSDLERDESSERLGSEGLVDVRTDERMPYIDQGYVDEDADVIGNFMKMFGGKKKE